MMRMLILLCVLVSSVGQQAGFAEAAEKFVRGAQWQPDSVIEDDFTCAGRGQHAILGISADHILVVVFIDGTTQPSQVLRYSTKARDARSATLALEDLDWDPKTEGLELPGFRRSRTCEGLSFSDGKIDAAHIYWNHEAKKFSDWVR
jgi:hypothetical protein